MIRLRLGDGGVMTSIPHPPSELTLKRRKLKREREEA
jgi:hypothetical protein